MDFFPAIWNVLHDGSIMSIQGAVPGTVRLAVSIEYLRERFADPGETIQEARDFCTDLPAIEASEPEILSAEVRSDISEVCCVGGTLEVRASSGSLALDSGRVITLQELIDVSEAYWTEWSERGKKARQET
jgi:hypothetical protein